MPILSLPPELIVHILIWCSGRDLVQCVQTCRDFYFIISDSSPLGYKIALVRAQLEDPTPHAPQSITAFDKISLFRRENAWTRLDIDSPETRYATLSTSPARVYELQHGVFAQGIISGQTAGGGIDLLRWSKLPRSLHPPNPSSTASPVEPGGSASIETTDVPLGFEIRDFNMDPEQNLAIYIGPAPPAETEDPQISLMVFYRELVVHVRQLSDNAPHPEARHPLLNLAVSVPPHTGYFVQIFGPFFGVMVKPINHGQAPRLWIWDWKRSVLQADMRNMDGLENFVFLSSTHVLLVRTDEGTLYFEIHEFFPRIVHGSQHRPPRPTRHLTTFEFPEFAHPDVVEVLQPIVSRCEPTPIFHHPDYIIESGLESEGPDVSISHSSTPATSADSDSDSASPNPFIDPNRRGAPRPGTDSFRLMAVHFVIEDQTEGLTQYGFTSFIAISDLYAKTLAYQKSHPRPPPPLPSLPAQTTNSLDFMDIDEPEVEEPYMNEPSTDSDVLHVQWDEWGPSSSRMMHGLSDMTWVCYIYGHRFVSRTWLRPTRKTSAWVWDFNPHTLHDRVGNGEAKESSVDLESITEGTESWEEGEGVVLEETVLTREKWSIWKDDVVTRLPFRKMRLRGRGWKQDGDGDDQRMEEEGFQGAWVPMIDEDRILMISRDSSEMRIIAL